MKETKKEQGGMNYHVHLAAHIAIYMTSLTYAAPFLHSKALLPICTPAAATYLPVGTGLLH